MPNGALSGQTQFTPTATTTATTQYILVPVQQPTNVGKHPYLPLTPQGHQLSLNRGFPFVPQMMSIKKQGVPIPKLSLITNMCQVPLKRKQGAIEDDKNIMRTSCEPGVRQARTPGRWVAHITIRGPGSSGYVHLGTFLTRDIASEVRLRAIQYKEENEKVDGNMLKRVALIRCMIPKSPSKAMAPP
jgi:hypothetical protein